MSSGSENLKISLEEIKSISNNFDKQNIIGRGGYGPVYLGQSEKHGVVAIKRLERGHGQGDHEYGMEVTLLSKYKHENLVSLVGFCGEDGEKILVYKYEANQSLDRLLINGEVLPWRRRLEICLGAARGFSYLHNETGTEHGVIHRDIKSSNILLDENWNAKISDFGLSRVALTSSADSILFTAACGTLGYIDPEYIKYGTLTQKSDVYSFGVVLFEVLFRKLVTVMGRDANGPRFTAEMAKKHYEEHTLDKLIDVDLRNEMNSASLCKFSKIAYECLKNHRGDRPTMKSVVKALENALGYHQRKSSSENPLGYQQLTISKHIELSTSEFSHDVYISFRSAEARTKHFVGWICDALEGEGVSIYKGNTTMFTKESVHLSAIKHTRSFIIVFSKNFAANSWNLDELAEIIKCNKERRNVVLPVYANDVHPCHVRELKGIFGEAMSKYDSDSRVGVWRNALVEAANLPGLLCDRLDTDIAKKVAASMKGQLLAKSQQYN